MICAQLIVTQLFIILMNNAQPYITTGCYMCLKMVGLTAILGQHLVILLVCHLDINKAT